MHGQGGVPDAHLGDPAKGGLEGGEQFGLQLAVDALPGKGLGHAAGDVLIEQDGVADPVGVLTEAADADVDVDACSLVHHPEGDGAGGAVLVAGELPGVEEVDPLVLGGLPAEGEALGGCGKGGLDALPQVPAEDGGLGGGVVDVLTGLGAELHHLPLVHDHHALAVGHHDDRAAGDDVVSPLGVGGPASGGLAALHHEDVGGDLLAHEKFLPLVSQHTAGCTQCSLYQSHR